MPQCMLEELTCGVDAIEGCTPRPYVTPSTHSDIIMKALVHCVVMTMVHGVELQVVQLFI